MSTAMIAPAFLGPYASAIDAWVKEGYALNSLLREDEDLILDYPLHIDVDMCGLIEAVDAMMTPLEQPLLVFRGSPLPPMTDRPDPGYLATTTDFTTASLFGDPFIIEVEPGVGMWDLESINSQREIVLGRNTQCQMAGTRIIQGTWIPVYQVSPRSGI